MKVLSPGRPRASTSIGVAAGVDPHSMMKAAGHSTFAMTSDAFSAYLARDNGGTIDPSAVPTRAHEGGS